MTQVFEHYPLILTPEGQNDPQIFKTSKTLASDSELHFLITPKIIFLKPRKLDILCTNKLASRMPKIRIYYNL